MSKFSFNVGASSLKEVVKYLSKSVGRESSHVSSHFVFKKKKGSTCLEVSSFNGNFFCCSDLNDPVFDPAHEFKFSFDAKRFSDAVSLLKDSEVVSIMFDDISIDHPKITMKTGTGRIKFQSMNAGEAPDWRDLNTSEEFVQVEASKIKSAFSFCSNFCKNLPQNPSISIIECHDGIVVATDGSTIAQVRSESFKGISIKTHINNHGLLRNALSFVKDGEKLSIYELTDRITFYKPETSNSKYLSNLLFGETKVSYSIPERSTKWDDVCDGYLMVLKEDMLTALNFINCGASAKTTSVQFVTLSTKENKLVFEMASSVDEEPAVGEVALLPNENLERDAIPVAVLDPCYFSFGDLVNVLKTLKSENIVIYLYLSSKNVAFCFRDDSSDLKYQVSVGGFLHKV
jgi:DNA polymerase III sliding clamp (beta) subunit (PCNA family)